MKKKVCFFIAIFCMLSSVCLADEWDDFSGVDHAWDGQKSITNQEFEQVMDALQAKQKQKEEKQKKRKIKKISGGGTSLHPDLAPNKDVPLQEHLSKNKDGLLLNIPVNLIIDEAPLDKGFYKVTAERDKNGDIYLNLYQSQFFKGKVKANETEDDYDSDELDFVKLVPYNDRFVKIIFGSLDFNAYAYVRYQ